jgi:hypothetical protein
VTEINFQRNLYPGVNAHLHSRLMADGEWADIHASLITHLKAQLNRALPSGYIARAELSVQLTAKFRPDVEILWTPKTPPHGHSPAISPYQPSPLVRDVLKVVPVDDEEQLLGIVIYATDQPDDPVVWIEIVSPSNKVGQAMIEYHAKRSDILSRGITFVEIDLIHTLPPTYALPIYSSADDQSRAYSIWFVAPRIPPDEPGRRGFALFGLADGIPDVRLPLLRGDSVVMSLGRAYIDMFAADPGWGRLTTYAAPPEDAKTYVQDGDRAVIAAVMDLAAELHAAGRAFGDDPGVIDLAPRIGKYTRETASARLGVVKG